MFTYSRIFILLNSRSSCPEVFCKKGALRYFVKFNRPESFFNKVAGLSRFIKKETLVQMFSWKFYEISKSAFTYRTPLVAASETRSSGP